MPNHCAARICSETLWKIRNALVDAASAAACRLKALFACIGGCGRRLCSCSDLASTNDSINLSGGSWLLLWCVACLFGDHFSESIQLAVLLSRRVLQPSPTPLILRFGAHVKFMECAAVPVGEQLRIKALSFCDQTKRSQLQSENRSCDHTTSIAKL